MCLKRRTLWQTILSFIWPLFALAISLFPVHPYQCKIVVLYSYAGASLFIVSLLLCKFSFLIPVPPPPDENISTTVTPITPTHAVISPTILDHSLELVLVNSIIRNDGSSMDTRNKL